MALLSSVDIYCERLGPELLAEPLNAATNLLFILAAVLMARRLRKLGSSDTTLWLLTALIALIGLGSLSFHTFANRLTGIFDVGFIGIFIFYYIVVLFQRAYRFNGVECVLGLIAFALGNVLVGQLLQYVGWITLPVYLTSLMLLWILSVDFSRRGFTATKPMFFAAMVFTVSLTGRTLDMPLCEALPIGTHFLWHSLNAIVLYLLLRVMEKFPATAPRN